MVVFDEDASSLSEKPHIHYVGDEDAHGVGPSVLRRPSASQLSTHSIRSLNRRRSIDPASALPIGYRTLSFHIEETSGKQGVQVRSAKERATAELADLDWHRISPEETYSRLASSASSGLSAEQIEKATAEYGPNRPSPPASRLMQKLFGYLFGGFGSVLLIGSVLVFVSWRPLGDPPAQANLALAVVLVAVFVIQAAFNAWQDFSSSRVMASITTMLPDSCLLLRNGTPQNVMAFNVVPGDIVYIKAGNKLPADVRFVECSSDTRFDRSILTGESAPRAGSVESTDDNYLETRCIGMQGTHCISGTALGVVVATGDRTVFGRIAKLTSEPKSESTCLEKEISRFVLIVVSLMVLMNIIVCIVWGAYLRHQQPDWVSVPALIVDIVSVAIAFVPVGLPIALTASLTITANIMKRNNILCKSLKTVETLGAVSVLCSDKTGTLTKNQMAVTDFCVGLRKFNTTEPCGDMAISANVPNNMLQQLRAVAAICNAGDFDMTTTSFPLADRKIIGDATDQAILRFSESLGPVQEIRDCWRKRCDVAFNSKNKYMIRVNMLGDTVGLASTLPMLEASSFDQRSDLLLTIKGAPDVLLGRCTSYVSNGGITRPFDGTVCTMVEEIKDAWSSQGKRVILLARKVLPASVIRVGTDSANFEQEAMQHASTGLTLVGLIGIIDPPRDEIPEVVRVLRRAGIRIFMVTGDFQLTAQAIAEACGIISNPPSLVHNVSNLSRHGPATVAGNDKDKATKPLAVGTEFSSIVLSGPELISLNQDQWNALCRYDEVVFARTTPEQKLRIVKEYQAHGKLVGMTGDGVNDAPSLKQADIGIAMGSGSDVAIEAADMVLLESFSAIVEAILYGRVVFDNLRKTIAYLLPAGSFSEIWPVMTNIIFGLPQILSSFLMIVICCFTDCGAAITLAYEKPEADVMLRPPRDPKKDRLVDWRLLLQAYGFLGVTETVASFSMAFWYAQRMGVPFSTLWFGFGTVPENLAKEYVTDVLNRASSIYFVNLVVMQCFSLMCVRTRHLSIFQHPPAFNRVTQNLYLFPAILLALVFVFVFNYPPGLQSVLGTADVPVEYFFLPIAFGIGILCIDECRKAAVRRWPGGLLAKSAW